MSKNLIVSLKDFIRIAKYYLIQTCQYFLRVYYKLDVITIENYLVYLYVYK